MNRTIGKVAVLGSGTMGSQIACHFANAGVDVLLLDIPPRELTEAEVKKGLRLDDRRVSNRIVDGNLKRSLELKPSPVYKREFGGRIETGNFDDDINRISDADWTVEAVVEKADLKRALYEKVDEHRKKGSLVTTNTSGIPIRSLIEGRSEDFQANFCGTHFFNPPRYLRLLEVIPSEKSGSEVVEFLERFGDAQLGKSTVVCKDSPGFIANRIGVYAIMLSIELMRDIGLTVAEIDRLTGTLVGRPRTATFRTVDLVGIDVLAEVSQGIFDNCPQDEERGVFQVPDFVQAMIDKDWLGQKTASGFYKKIEGRGGGSEILALDIDRMEYRAQGRPKFLILEALKSKPTLDERIQSFERGDTRGVNLFKKGFLKLLGGDNDKAVEFFRQLYYRLFAYSSNRIPEISDEPQAIDQTIKAGFNWESGPFELWDMLGPRKTVEKMEERGYRPAAWVYEMLEQGHDAFYRREGSVRTYYDVPSRAFKDVPGARDRICLSDYRATRTIWRNAGCDLIDLGDGVLNIAFTSKRNTIDTDVLAGINEAIDMAEREHAAIIIANEGEDFSFGANLAMIGINAFKKRLSVVEDAVVQFQRTVMRVRHCSVPVVAAPHGRTLGGAAELCMHADCVQAAAETYMGLVEVGVGLIPAGAGTKEFVLRASDSFVEGDPKTPHLQKRILTVAQAQVSTSAHEAFDLGYLRSGVDDVTMNRDNLVADAKRKALEIASKGYTPVKPRNDIKVLGRNALGFFYTAICNMRSGNYITDYDQEVARTLAYVMCGGDLTAETLVSERYLLDLEREAFMSLVGNRKTLRRIEHILKKGKPLRN